MKTRIPFLIIILVASLLGVGLRQGQAAIGYYNISLQPGRNLIAVQLRPVGSSNANNALQYTPVDGSLLYRFNPVTQSYYDAATYVSGIGWVPPSGNTNDPALNLPLGEGFFVWTPQSWTATIVGEVPTGTVTNPLPANFSLKASILPIGGGLQTILTFPPYDDDIVWRWASPAFSQSSFFGGWDPAEPSLAVGEGFVLYRSPAEATPDHWWVQNFNPLYGANAVSGTSASAEIRSLSFRGGQAVLGIQNDRGSPYNVQYSADGAAWKTVATGQTGDVWQEPARAGAQGYYQLVNP